MFRSNASLLHSSVVRRLEIQQQRSQILVEKTPTGATGQKQEDYMEAKSKIL